MRTRVLRRLVEAGVTAAATLLAMAAYLLIVSQGDLQNVLGTLPGYWVLFAGAPILMWLIAMVIHLLVRGSQRADRQMLGIDAMLAIAANLALLAVLLLLSSTDSTGWLGVIVAVSAVAMVPCVAIAVGVINVSRRRYGPRPGADAISADSGSLAASDPAQ